MNCQQHRGDWAGFHFAELEPERRRALEEHLLDCRACVAEYLTVKREIELAPGGPRPSLALKARIRQSLARELAPERSWRWWERPLAVAFAVAVLVAALSATSRIATGPGAPPHGGGDPPADSSGAR